MKKIYFLPNSLDINKVGPILEHLYLNKDTDELYFVSCDNVMKTCPYNHYGDEFVCQLCKKNTNRIINCFDFFSHITIYKLSDYKVNICFNIKSLKLETLSDFQQLYWDNDIYDVGFAIVSTFVSRKRDISNEITNKEKKELINSYVNSIILYESFKNLIEREKPDEINIFNGRLFDTRPLLRLCKSKNINCNIIEISGYQLKNWIIYKNTLPHDINEYTNNLEKTWDSESDIYEKIKIGSSFFDFKIKGLNTNDKSYVSYQSFELLPSNFNPNKINIVIYNSSEDEFFSIGPEWKKYFDTQLEGIKFICEKVKNLENYHIYLRIHPNLNHVKAEFVKELYKLNKLYNNLTVIKPNSKISSYQLMFKSDKIITFGSTIGIEATYFGKPSLSLGTSFYNKIDGAYTINECDDPVISKFIFENLPPKSKDNAIKYGYFQMKAGIPFKFWKKDKFKNLKIPQINVIEKFIYLSRYTLFKIKGKSYN